MECLWVREKGLALRHRGDTCSESAKELREDGELRGKEWPVYDAYITPQP